VITGSVGAAAIAAVVIYAATTTDHHTTALVPPATTTGAQTRPVTAVANGLPTDTGTAIPVSAFTVPITHTGIYSYTSPPLPITHASNAMGFGQKFIGGQVTMRMLASPSGGTGMDITETAAGKWVIEAHFDVVSYTGHPVLQFQNAFVEGTAGQ
jgi:hypothetical protein